MTTITTREDFIWTYVEKKAHLLPMLNIDAAICDDCGIPYRMISDDDVVSLYGSIDAFKTARERLFKQFHEKQIAAIADEIRTMAGVRLFGDVELWPDYDSDEVDEIAIKIYGECRAANE